MNYIDILNNNNVIDSYKKIDEVNLSIFNHGLKHIKNVCKYMDKLTDILGIDKIEKDALLITCALHDIGQVDGVNNHGRRSKNYIINNFESQLKDNPFYNDILFSVETHDFDCNMEENIFSLLVKFCDKMDFTKDRLVDNYNGYCCFEDVLDINFINTDEYFGIDIFANEVDDFEDSFFKHEFTTKIFNCVDVLATKLNKNSIVRCNGREISYELHKKMIRL